MHPYQDKSRGIRLQKVLADAGVAARRACETLIETGRVAVNGEVITELPAWVDPVRDRIDVDGMLVAGPNRHQRRRMNTEHPAARPPVTAATPRYYLMVNKPRGIISTTRDPEGRRSVLDLVDADIRARLYPVGRLDADSGGLILLTDDGELANRLTHPRYEVPKVYEVVVRGQIPPDMLERLGRGIHLAGRRPGRPDARKASADRVRILNRMTDRRHGDRTTLEITLSEGQNREIRRMLARLNLKVHRLRRIAIGPLRLKGVASGQWRVLTAREVQQLRQACEMTSSGQKADRKKK